MDAKERFARIDWQDLITSLDNPDFYLQVVIATVAISLATLFGTLLKRSGARLLARRPLNPLVQNIAAQTLTLLPPLFAILYLSIARPIVQEMTGSVKLIGGLAELSVAWLCIQLVFLLVRSRPVAWLISAVLSVIALLSVTGFLVPTTTYLRGFSFTVGKFNLSMLGILQGIVSFVVVFWLAGTLSRSMNRYLQHFPALNYNTRELIVKFFALTLYFIAFVVTLDAMGVDLTALAVFGGALGVGVGLGLQRITANFVSGITLLIEKSVKIGDLIDLSGTQGWVRQLNMRYTVLEMWDGRELLVPNEELMTSRVINITADKDKIRNSIKLWISYHSDMEKASALMRDAAVEHPRAQKSPAPACDLIDMDSIGYVLELTFWVKDIRKGYGGPRNDVLLSIARKFRANGILIASPRQEAVTGSLRDTLPVIQEQGGSDNGNEAAKPATSPTLD